MTGRTDLGVAVFCAALMWFGPAAADPLEVQQVLELDGERWRVAGTLTSSITGAELVIFEEEVTRRSKIARPDEPPFQGVTILAVLSDKVLLEVDGCSVSIIDRSVPESWQCHKCGGCEGDACARDIFRLRLRGLIEEGLNSR